MKSSHDDISLSTASPQKIPKMSSYENSEVSLTIRTPTLADEDVEISCRLEWTVIRVKREIEQRFEKRPRPADQRLVYAGKLLEDHSVLGDVLRLDDEVSSYTVHLVCRQTSFPKPAVAATTATAAESETAEGGPRRRVSASAAASAAPTVDANPQAATSSYPGYDMASWAAMQQHMSAAMANSSPSSGGEEQSMWMQHMYAQYMAHYMQYVQSAAMGSAYPQAAVAFMQPQPPQPAPAPNLDPAPMAPGMNPPGGHAPDNEEQPLIQPQPPPVAAPGAPAAPAAPPPQVINAGAGGAMAGLEEDDDENQQRDALDWLYIASRVLVLFSIVYFYSSLTRFLVVAVCGFFAYLWNMGAFRRDRDNVINAREDGGGRGQEDQREQERETAEEGEAANQPAEEPALSAAGADGDDAAVADADDGAALARDAAVVGQQGGAGAAGGTDLVASAFTFVTTFFSSLLPDQPQVV